MHLHVRTCVSLFRTSVAAGRIMLKFVMWVEIHQLCVLYDSWMRYQYMHVPNLGVHGSILLKYVVLFDPLTMSLTQCK